MSMSLMVFYLGMVNSVAVMCMEEKNKTTEKKSQVLFRLA